MHSPTDTQTAPSFLAPLRSTAYSVLLLATIVSNIGTWMHDVGASWLMTELTRSPLLIALVQTMTTLPIFLFALPAGALADILDKRKLLIVIQIFMAVTAALMAAMVYAGLSEPLWVLVFTFLLGTGAAFVAPAWQAIVPKLVDKPLLSSAIALNGVGINISRAIGPALAGALIVAIGLYAPFVVNALSFLAIIAALWWWKPTTPPAQTLPKESLIPAMVAGFRFARHSRELQVTLARAFAFFVFASAFWSLLPLVVKLQLAGNASSFGVIMASIGAGAVMGATFLPRLKALLSAHQMVFLTSCLIALLLLATAWVSDAILLGAISLGFGMAWIWTLATLNVAAQSALPDWVRGRGLAIFLTVFFGSLSAGSMLWGALASSFTVSVAMQIAAALMFVAALLTLRLPLQVNTEYDLSPSMHWPVPLVDDNLQAGDAALGERSPVMVTIEYVISPANQARFLTLMHELKQVRMQLGAWQWHILQDASNPQCFVEHFMESSWLAHLRHHARVSGRDRDLQQQIRALHEGDEPPHVRHLLGGPG